MRIRQAKREAILLKTKLKLNEYHVCRGNIYKHDVDMSWHQYLLNMQTQKRCKNWK